MQNIRTYPGLELSASTWKRMIPTWKPSDLEELEKMGSSVGLQWQLTVGQTITLFDTREATIYLRTRSFDGLSESSSAQLNQRLATTSFTTLSGLRLRECLLREQSTVLKFVKLYLMKIKKVTTSQVVL